MTDWLREDFFKQRKRATERDRRCATRNINHRSPEDQFMDQSYSASDASVKNAQFQLSDDQS